MTSSFPSGRTSASNSVMPSLLCNRGCDDFVIAGEHDDAEALRFEFDAECLEPIAWVDRQR